MIVDALKLGFQDFEDAIIHESAKCINADAIVTRNVKDFKKAKIKVQSPIELLNSLRMLGLIDQDDQNNSDNQSDQIPGDKMD